MYGLYVWIVVFLASGKGCKQVANIQKLVHLDGLDMFGFVGRNPLFFDFQGFPALESTWNLHRTENHEEEQLVDQPSNLHGQQVHRLLSWNNMEYVFFPCLMIYKEAPPHVIPHNPIRPHSVSGRMARPRMSAEMSKTLQWSGRGLVAIGRLSCDMK